MRRFLLATLVAALAIACSAGEPSAQMQRRESPALIALQQQGVIRPATQADVDAWHQAVSRRLRALGAVPLRSEYLRPSLSYVVLRPMVAPPEMYGGHSRSFIVARSVPMPTDAGSDNKYYSIGEASCTGLDIVCREIEAAREARAVHPRLHCALPAPNQLIADLSNEGPARLRDIYCHRSPASHFSRSSLIVSADARHLARVYYPGTLRVAELSRTTVWNDWSSNIARTELQELAPARWDPSGPVLWTSLQEKVPSGWAAGRLRVARISAAGFEEMGPIANAPGRLDRVRWVGDGLALAYFDIRGDYYRPELPDALPAIAMLDARAARVLASVSMAELAQIGLRVNASASTSGTLMPDGRLRVIMAGADWAVWTQGEAPRRLDIERGPHASFALAPNGATVLVTGLLRASGMICEHNPNCPPPTPQSGVWAALHEVESGRTIWERQGTAVTFGGVRSPPVIRSDGRFAIMPLPPNGSPFELGLVSMRDGRVLQRFPGVESFGFTSHGIWLEHGGTIGLFDLHPHAR